MNIPTNSDDVIDSRDVIQALEELDAEFQSRYDEYLDDLDGEGEELDFEDWLYDQDTSELDALKSLTEQAENSPDWEYGETLIRESYFTRYIEELIDDCYELPKEFNSGNWPWRHMTMDYEAAAEETKVDYMEVDFDGVTYLIRA